MKAAANKTGVPLKNSRTILLVDDDSLLRDIMRGALEREYIILEASCLAETLRLSGNAIDLAVIDYVLPDGNGFGVLKALRKKLPALPAIIVTGYSDESVVIKAIRSTVADYIKKPLNLKYLGRRIAEILGEIQTTEPYDDVAGREEFILDGIVSYIKEHYMDGLTLDKLSRLACMGRFKFCRGFKKRFGRSFVTYINNVRTDNAAQFLKNHDQNITEIAHIVGYENVVHFERVFKGIYGMAPRDYRKTYKVDK